MQEFTLDKLDDILEFVESIKYRKLNGKPKQRKRKPFSELEGFSRFLFRGIEYVRLNARLALNLHSRESEIMEWTAKVTLIELDYLHGLEPYFDENELVSEATIFIEDNKLWPKPKFVFRNTDLQKRGIGAKRAIELAKAGLY